MKIAVTGKGGVGKTTFAATLARSTMQQREDRYLQQMWIRMRVLVPALG
ncbi:MAG: ArsA-related P-loop ATPase [Blautia wexlerae]